MRPAELHIDLDALRHNVRLARQLAGSRQIHAAVKADAYGHGLLPVARVLCEEGVDGLAVACIEEALALREAGFNHGPIVLLEGFHQADELNLCRTHTLEPVLHQAWQVALLEANLGAVERVWLKLDTGMHRLGFAPQQAAMLHQRLQRSGVHTVGWLTHMACADDVTDPMTSRQQRCFEAAVEGLPGPRSLANSAGLLAWPTLGGDVVRPGLMLYGASPVLGRSAADLGLRPVMRFRTELIAVHRLAKGETVGYGATWRCPHDETLVGVAAIGYGDGYPRHAPSGTPVWIQGQRAALAGRVSMDMIGLDLSAVPQARIGDEVVLWGPELPIDEVATCANTIPYTLSCAVLPRVPRRLSSR